MADISKTNNHNIESDELRKRLEELAGEMERKFGIKYQWEGDTCHLSGKSIKGGKLIMTDTTISIELTLGMMAKMVKGQIEKEIDSKMAKLLQA